MTHLRNSHQSLFTGADSDGSWSMEMNDAFDVGSEGVYGRVDRISYGRNKMEIIKSLHSTVKHKLQTGAR